MSCLHSRSCSRLLGALDILVRLRRRPRLALGVLLGIVVLRRESVADDSVTPAALRAPDTEELALAHLGGAPPRATVPPLAPPVPATAAARVPALIPGPESVRKSDPSTSLPWVHAGDIEKPESLGDPGFEVGTPEFSPWVLFEERLDKRNAPAAVPDYFTRDFLPLFYVPPPRETELSLKIQKLIRKKMYREIRSRVRREWRDQFRDSPSISYSQYEERLIRINHIGRDQSEFDSFDVEYSTIETKQDLFRYKNKDGEADIPLLNLGPFIVTDSGQVRFDVGTATHSDDVRLDVGGEQKKCLVGGENFRVDTQLDFKFDPLSPFDNGAVYGVIRSYGITVEIDYLTDVLSRDMISAEIECEADFEGEYAVFALQTSS
jgi:hypothetical protein